MSHDPRKSLIPATLAVQSLVLLLASALRAATIEGTISGCSRAEPAVGSVVKGFEAVRAGFESPFNPCSLGAVITREVGTATVGVNGGYSITFTPTPRERGSCAFEAKVFIQVFASNGGTLIRTSDPSDLGPSVTINLNAGDPNICGQVMLPELLEFDPGVAISGGPPVVGRLALRPGGGSVPRSSTVQLFASDPEAVSLPPSLPIAAGQTVADFEVSAISPEAKMVTIFAVTNGVTTQADLAIQGNGPWKGFINGDQKRDISDAVFLLNFLFSGGPAPANLAFADVNGSFQIDISDAVALLGFLFSTTQIPPLCDRDPATLPTNMRLNQELVTDGDRVLITGNLPAATFRVVLKGFAFPNGRLVSGGEVIGERRLVYCSCQPAVRTVGSGPDGEPFFQLPFNVPLDAPSGEYEVYVLPDSAPCPAGNAVSTGCLEDSCAIGPMKLFVQTSHIVTLWDDLNITDDSEPRGDSPSELFFTFGSQTGEPDPALRFPVVFADSYPGGRPGSQHLTSGALPVAYQPDVPVFVGREADMERTECEEECASDPDPARCRSACAEAARRMNTTITLSFGGVEFDCLSSCSSIWDEVAAIGIAAVGCLAGLKFGEPAAGCAAGGTLGALIEGKLEDAIEDEDDVLGAAEFTFSRGPSPFWSVGGTSPPAGLSRTDIDIGVSNHRLPAFRIVDAKLHLKSITLVEADDEACFAPDEIFFETRGSLGLNGRLGDATRFPATEGVPIAEGETRNLGLLGFSLDAGSGAESSIFYVEIGVWDFDGDDEAELIGLQSKTFILGDLLEAQGVPAADFVTEGRERRRIRLGAIAHVTGWNSEERCDCTGIGACAIDPTLPHGIADVSYEVEVVWEKYPQQ